MLYRRSHVRFGSLKLNSRTRVVFPVCRIPSRNSHNDNETIDHSVPLKMLKMIHSFRNRGHFAATLDPLMSESGGRISSWLPEEPEQHPDVVRMLRRYPAHLDLRPFQLERASLSKKFYLGNEVKSASGQTEWTIPELVNFMSEAYCGNAGIEFAHIDNGKTSCYRIFLKTSMHLLLLNIDFIAIHIVLMVLAGFRGAT